MDSAIILVDNTKSKTVDNDSSGANNSNILIAITYIKCTLGTCFGVLKMKRWVLVYKLKKKVS